MKTIITIALKDLDPKQVQQMSKDLTAEYGEYGKRFTEEQVRCALWESLDDLITSYLEDLSMIYTSARRFDEYLGKPESFDDPRTVCCTYCGHPRGEHEADGKCGYVIGDIDCHTTCSCGQYFDPSPYQIAVETRAREINAAHEGNMDAADVFEQAETDVSYDLSERAFDGKI